MSEGDSGIAGKPAPGPEAAEADRLSPMGGDKGLEATGAWVRQTRQAKVADTVDESAGLRACCPECRESFSVVGQSLADITCSHCGAQFNLVDDPQAGRAAGDGVAAAQRRCLGPFELLAFLGAGSFGTVWKARDTRLDRLVALKTPRAGRLGRDEAETFFREARAAAQLRHPYIVTVHEVGKEGDQVYIVSDLIEGRRLDEWLAAGKPRTRDAVELCAKIADALHHAHEQGIVHRDLKPGNILVDAQGEPHLMDFGLAKREVGEMTMTLDGQILGTPAYMSPEQARGESHRVDRRADVYSLGVVLFELLTGERPFRGNVQMLLKQIAESEPPNPRTLDGRLPRDLETVCLKCLEKEPRRRYGSAKEVSDELRRFLRGETIEARPIGRWGRAWKWCRRNSAVASLTAVATFLMAMVAVVAAVGYVRTSKALSREETQRKVAQGALLASQESEGRAVTARQNAEEATARLLIEQVDLLRRNRPPGWTWKGRENLAEALRRGAKTTDRVKLRGLASSCLIEADLRPQRNLAEGENSFCVAFSPDGKHLAIAQYKAQVYAVCKVSLVSLGGGATRTFSYSPSVSWQIRNRLVQDGGRSLAFSPDGRWLVVGTRSGWLHRWELGQTQPPGASWQAHDDEVNDLVFSPDGKSLYSASSDQTAARWDVAGGWKRAASYRGKTTLMLALSHDGARLAVRDQSLRWLDPLTLEPTARTIGLHVGIIRYCGATRLLVAEWRKSLILLDDDRADPVAIKTLADPKLKAAHSSEVCGLAASPNGSLLLSGDLGGQLKLWDVASGRLLYSVPFPGAGNVFPAFDPTGRNVATTADLRVVLLDLGGVDACSTTALQEWPVRALAALPDGETLGSLGGNDQALGEIRLWQMPGGKLRSSWVVNPGFTPTMHASLTLCPSDGLIAASGDRGQVHLVRLGSAEARDYLAPNTAGSLAFSADGLILWGIRGGEEVVGWDSASVKDVFHWSNRMAAVTTGRAAIHSLAVGKDWIVAGSETVGAALLLAKDGRFQAQWPSPGGAVTAAALRPDDTLAAMGTHKGTLRVVGIPDGRALAEWKAHSDRIESLSFRGDGRMLASASRDGTVCLARVDRESAEPLVSLSFDDRPVDAVRFVENGKSLAVLLHGENAVRLVRLDSLRAGLAAMTLDW